MAEFTVCPASPSRTSEMLRDRWPAAPALTTDHFLQRRHQVMGELRRGGDPARAERFGWRSLAALWLGCSVSDALDVNTGEHLDWSHSNLTPPASSDTAAGSDVSSACVPVPGTSLFAVNVADRTGPWMCDLAAAVTQSAVVHVDGQPVAAGIVAAALRGALT